ncbi:SigE family RNA polymerase sigma factor [Streptomyces piniterrae]|uniref:SigE family RNA polymerase sigma factor n=1 Tax=Streptomyces piniterrae TaxID=2571125 RepID=A0A4U0N900_9ACTN|nr:SigE family RNA polymerase sigma factor [Streptomyces piniterrae]TJZ50339.1 SigE family RNA polymerase sigma factor [Streptomyces piniterrae]
MEYSATQHSAPVRFAVPGLRHALWQWLLRAARPATARRESPRPSHPSPVTGEPAGTRPQLPTPFPSPDSQPTISELYHAHRLNMVRLAVMLVDDRATAEDVVQDAFAALYKRHGEQLGEVDNALAYLRTAVVNAARSVLRRRRTARDYTPPYEADAPSAEERIVLDEEHREVFAALGRLTTRRREVLVLRYWGDLTEAQIAATLGISRGSVKSIASRALDSLEKILEGRS